MFSYEEIIEIIDKLRKEEAENCAKFCELNPNYTSMSIRESQSQYYNSALLRLSCELNEIYKIRRKKYG